MNNEATILNFITINPNCCDDCISEQTRIKPRQQVNSLCRELYNKAQINRTKQKCRTCNGKKITNSKK